MAYLASGKIIGARALGTAKAGVAAASAGAAGGGHVASGAIAAGGFTSAAHAPFLGPVTVEIVATAPPATGQRWPR